MSRLALKVAPKPFTIICLVILAIVGSAFTIGNLSGRAKTQQAAQSELQQPQQLPQTESQQPPAPSINCHEKACVALTFDDGPSPHTERLLDILKDKGAKATFYMLGVYVERHADAVKRMVSEGHQLGNHTWVHLNLLKMKDHEVRAEVDKTNLIIQRISGVKPDTMRPPFGLADERIVKVSDMPQILWDVDPYDWETKDPNIVADRIISVANKGSIVLVHDIYPTTVDAVPKIIDGLRAKGLEPATVNELLNKGQTPVLGEYHRQ